MRKTKVFTIFLGVSLLAVNVMPNIEKKLFAEEEHSAYVKIDSKVTNRFEVEQAIRQA